MVVLEERDNKPALLLAVASIAVYGISSGFVTGPEQTPWFLAAYSVAWMLYLGLFLHGRNRDFVASPWVLLVWAGLGRLLLCPTEPWLSDDLWRYLLDGRVLLEGTNPFRYAPEAPWVQERFGALAARVNHPEVPTIYPPLVQLTGALAALFGLMETGWRVLVSLIDLAAMFVVSRLFGGGDRGWRAAAVYGLCPLAIFEAGANGHLEALATLPLVYAVRAMQQRRPWRAGVAFAAAILVKYYAILLLPLWWRRQGFRRMAATSIALTLLALLPFMLGGVDIFAGLKAYLSHWSFNSPLYALLGALPVADVILRAAPYFIAAAVALIAGWRRDDPVAVIPMLLFGFLVIGPTLHPWYALWILPWLGARPHPGLWAFVAAMGLSYAVWWSVALHGVWELPAGVPEIMWSIVAIGWLFSFWRHHAGTPEAA